MEELGREISKVGRRPPTGREEEEEDKQRLLHDEDDEDDEGRRQPYKCGFCRRGFPTAQALGGHMNVHRRKEYRPGPRPAGSGGVICSYGEPPPAVEKTLAGGGHQQQPACSTPAAGGSSMLFNGVERAPRALRLFGHEIVDSGAAAGRGQCYDGRNGDDDDHGGQGDVEEGELDLELRLGAAGQY